MNTQRRQALLASLALTGLAAGLIACTPVPGTGGSADPAANEVAEAPVSAEEQVRGAWGAAEEEPNLPRLEFQEGGTLVGTDGCNGISGTYSVDGDSVLLDQAASTLRACEDVDDWLRGGTEIRVDGDQVHVLNAEGTEIGQLDRAK